MFGDGRFGPYAKWGDVDQVAKGGIGPMLLLVLLALLAIIAFGVGFTVHWLFIVAVILAVVWLISLLAGGAAGRTRGNWW